MTDRELIYIKTIAECKSFSKAAKALYMTQPSLSQCVANIEKELGTPLFVRSTKGLTLTFAGERYCQAAYEILNIYEDMTQDICEMGELKIGRIKLGITNYLSSWLMPRVMPYFNEKYPGIQISLTERNSTEIENMLIARELDFAFLHSCEGLPEARTVSLEFTPIGTDPFVIVLPKGSELGKYSVESSSSTGLRELDLKYLRDERFILGVPEQRIRQVDDLILRKAGITPNISLTTRNYDTARRLASKGMGVTIIPWQYVLLLGRGDLADYYAIPAKYRAGWTLSYVTIKNSYLSKASKTFIDMCCEKLKDL